jgi:hypothetical protein
MTQATTKTEYRSVSEMAGDAEKPFLDKRTPKYDDRLPFWKFLRESYEGGPEWFNCENLPQYQLEDDGAYKARVKRATRLPITRKVVDTYVGHIFRTPATRKAAGKHIEDFRKKASLKGDSLIDQMRAFAAYGSLYRVFLVVDRPEGYAATKADEKAPYAYMVGPEDVLNYSWGADGQLNWVLLREWFRDDADPIKSTMEVKPRYRLWTRKGWRLFMANKDKPDGYEELTPTDGRLPTGEIPHGFKKDCVPGHFLDFREGNEWLSVGLVDDIAPLDREIAGLLSCLNEILHKQTFSQLVMPQDLLDVSLIDATGKINETMLKAAVKLGLNSVLWTNPDAKQGPQYISPDAAQAVLLLDAVSRKLEQSHELASLRNESSKSGAAESGTAQQIDFDQRLGAVLVSFAANLQKAEMALYRLVDLWNGGKGDIPDDLVTYPPKFDVSSLSDDLANAVMLQELPGRFSPTFLVMLCQAIARKALPDLPAEVLAIIDEEIKARIETEQGDLHGAQQGGTAANGQDQQQAPPADRQGQKQPAAAAA